MKKIDNKAIVGAIIVILGIGFYLLASNGFLPNKSVPVVLENENVTQTPVATPKKAETPQKAETPEAPAPNTETEAKQAVAPPVPRVPALIDPLQGLVNAKYNAYYALAKKYGGTVSFYSEIGGVYYMYGFEEVGNHDKTEEIKDKKCFQYINGSRSGQQAGIWNDMYMNEFGSGEATTFGGYQIVDIKNNIVCEILQMSGATWARGQERASDGEYICCGYYSFPDPEIIRDPKTMEVIK